MLDIRSIFVVCWALAAAVDLIGIRLIVRGARVAGNPDQTGITILTIR